MNHTPSFPISEIFNLVEDHGYEVRGMNPFRIEAVHKDTNLPLVIYSKEQLTVEFVKSKLIKRVRKDLEAKVAPDERQPGIERVREKLKHISVERAENSDESTTDEGTAEGTSTFRE